MRILIVDPAPSTRMAARTALRELRATPSEFLEADNGYQALALIKQYRLKIDLILADWDMPCMGGEKFLKKLRLLAPVHDLPVLVLAHHNQLDQMEVARGWGARDYLLRPFTLPSLREKASTLASEHAPSEEQDTERLLRSIADATKAPIAGPFIAQLPGALADDLYRAAVVRTYPAGTTLVIPGQELQAFQYLLRGELELRIPGRPGQREIRSVGDSFCEREFLAGEPARHAVLVRERATVAAISQIRLGELVEANPPLSLCLSRLLACRSNPPLTEPPPAEPRMTGSLETVSVSDLIQVLATTRKTGQLTLSLEGRSAGVSVEDGEVRHAWIEDWTGEKAFYAILGARSGAFIFESGRRPRAHTINRPSMNLLMEGARLQDEERRESISAS